jgi:hypothetical protein
MLTDAGVRRQGGLGGGVEVKWRPSRLTCMDRLEGLHDERHTRGNSRVAAISRQS